MHRSPLTLLLLVLGALCGLAPTAFAQRRAAVPDELDEVPTLDGWKARILRDERVSFTPRTVLLAETDLKRRRLGPNERAVALAALSSGKATLVGPILATWARDGALIERRAAVLALGEVGGKRDLLASLAQDPEPVVAECALLALLRTGKAENYAIVERVANDSSDELSSTAQDLLVFWGDPFASRPTAPGALFLNLRWNAARRYGLVDGQDWSVVVTRQLTANHRFLQEVVLRAGARMKRRGVKDHILNELLHGTGSGRLQAAVICMPRELTQLVRYGLWKPADEGEWRVILNEISREHVESETVDLLFAALEVPPIRYHVTALLARTGATDGLVALEDDLTMLPARARVWACEAMADSGSARWIPELDRLRNTNDLPVQAATLVAAYRLGSQRARDDLISIVGNPVHPLQDFVVEMMCRSARDSRIADWLEKNVSSQTGSNRLRVSTALAQRGRLAGRARLREILKDEMPRGDGAVEMIAALSRRPSPEDAELLSGMFPIEGEFSANVELAVALLGMEDPSVQPIVRSAIWTEDWDRSILAAGLLVEIGGVRALVDEIERLPAGASTEDIRRVGFALGQWGGIDQVTALARVMRYSSGHPAVQGALLGALGARTH